MTVLKVAKSLQGIERQNLTKTVATQTNVCYFVTVANFPCCNNRVGEIDLVRIIETRVGGEVDKTAKEGKGGARYYCIIGCGVNRIINSGLVKTLD